LTSISIGPRFLSVIWTMWAGAVGSNKSRARAIVGVLYLSLISCSTGSRDCGDGPTQHTDAPAWANAMADADERISVLRFPYSK
jgi:hypothetical protein